MYHEFLPEFTSCCLRSPQKLTSAKKRFGERFNHFSIPNALHSVSSALAKSKKLSVFTTRRSRQRQISPETKNLPAQKNRRTTSIYPLPIAAASLFLQAKKSTDSKTGLPICCTGYITLFRQGNAALKCRCGKFVFLQFSDALPSVAKAMEGILRTLRCTPLIFACAKKIYG